MYIPIVQEVSRATAHPAQRAPIPAHRPPHETRTIRLERVVRHRPGARS
jgi:hypothetical protein